MLIWGEDDDGIGIPEGKIEASESVEPLVSTEPVDDKTVSSFQP